MNIVCFAATKGGVGKTTLATAIAVKAASEGARVCMIDADQQLSLSRWWELRGMSDNPKMLDVDASMEGIGLIAADGWDLVVIDTPPAIINTIEDAIASADLVVIPARPSVLDVMAVEQVTDLCDRHGKPYAYVLNGVHHQWGKLADSAAQYLQQCGPVFKTRIGLRKSYVTAMTLGQGATEQKDASATAEIDALWGEICAAIAKARVHA